MEVLAHELFTHVSPGRRDDTDDHMLTQVSDKSKDKQEKGQVAKTPGHIGTAVSEMQAAEVVFVAVARRVGQFPVLFHAAQET